MADLFQSHYDLGSLRRGVQDGETLWGLLAEDGTITIVPDPTGAEVLAAQEKLAKLEPEKLETAETAPLHRVASFQVAEEEAELAVLGARQEEE